MGIYDREYIRGESSGTGLFGGVSPVTKSIIAINVVTFLLQNLLFQDGNRTTLEWLAASPEQTFHHLRLFQLLTAAFVDLNPLSLFFNMYFFWFMGREMESRYGSREFLLFYLTSAVLSTLAGLVVAASAGIVNAHVFGPWGPILAVMTLYTLFYPRQEILFFFIIPMPMWALLSIYILIPLLGRFGGRSPGIDLAMVLAGAGYAYAYKNLDLRWSHLTTGRRFRPRLRIFSSSGYDQGRPRGWTPSRTSSSVGAGGRSPAVSVLPEEQLDARVDEILAKIAREGNRESLTDEEQRILQEASRRARIRRSDRI
jgi:membrane associated rhomboid family serine protease